MLGNKPLEIWSVQISSLTTLFLLSIKAWASIQTHILTLLSLLLDSSLDAIASGLNYYFIPKSFQKLRILSKRHWESTITFSLHTVTSHYPFNGLVPVQKHISLIFSHEIRTVLEGVYILAIL